MADTSFVDGAELALHSGGYGGGGFRRRGFRGGGFGNLSGCQSQYFTDSAADADWPCGEDHLVEGIKHLTRVEPRKSLTVEPIDDDIVNYPWIYAVEVGRWYLDESDDTLSVSHRLISGRADLRNPHAECFG